MVMMMSVVTVLPMSLSMVMLACVAVVASCRTRLVGSGL
jgi:hypothetical protein